MIVCTLFNYQNLFGQIWDSLEKPESNKSRGTDSRGHLRIRKGSGIQGAEGKKPMAEEAACTVPKQSLHPLNPQLILSRCFFFSIRFNNHLHRPVFPVYERVQCFAEIV